MPPTRQTTSNPRSLAFAAMRLPLIVLLSLPLCLGSSAPSHSGAPSHSDQQLFAELAAANDGVIRLDDARFALLTSSPRNWSAAIQFTALDPRRKCFPCKGAVF